MKKTNIKEIEEIESELNSLQRERIIKSNAVGNSLKTLMGQVDDTLKGSGCSR